MSFELGSCSSRHSRLRNRDRDQDRREQQKSQREHSRKKDTGKIIAIGKNSEEYILEVAEGEDYDQMLSLMYDALGEMKSVSKKYFTGNLPDAEAEKMVKEINERYRPVKETLEKADSEGKLNYNQHKKQMKLFAELLKIYEEIINRISNDLKDVFQ